MLENSPRDIFYIIIKHQKRTEKVLFRHFYSYVLCPLVLFIEQGNAVDSLREVRCGLEVGFVECAIKYRFLLVRREVAVCIQRERGLQFLAADGELGSIEYLEGTIRKSGLYFRELVSSACCRNVFV